MAKKQTFTSKLGKEKKNFKIVKYIQTLLSEKTGHIKFLSRMIRMEENENIDQALKREEEESSNVLAFGEQPEEEAPVEETPAEEETPVEEELKEEQAAEETPAEEEAPVEEETPIEEPAEEVSEEESAPEEDSAEKAEESSKE